MTAPKDQLIDARPMYSGLIRLHILHHSGEGEIFGLGMIEELAKHGYRLSPGTLYPVLHGLEEDGLLDSYEICVSGKIRRVYRITTAGQRVLMAAKEKVRELFGELFEIKAGSKLARTRSRVRSVASAAYRRKRAAKATL
jgi:PadR family transcriptional regulator PadR